MNNYAKDSKKNKKAGVLGDRANRYRGHPHVPAGVLIPGFLIVQRNGVVRLNKRYKGDDPYHPGE